MPPLKAWEAGEVAICGDPLSSRLDCHGSKKGVRDEVARGSRGLAELHENLPVSRPRNQDGTSGLVAKSFSETPGIFGRAWRIEDLWMCGDAEKPAQGKIGDTEGLSGVDEL
jgi:hypothetical protein